MIDAVGAVGAVGAVPSETSERARERQRAERAGRCDADGIKYVQMYSGPTYGADDDARRFLRYENTLVINTTISDFDFPQTHRPIGILLINKDT